jgi:formylglycine-generating enzyme required for sulfatase activity
MRDHWGSIAWDWLRKYKKDLASLGQNNKDQASILPLSWDNAEFGKFHPSGPMAAVSWYEANAYCKWQLAHWDELEEGRRGFPRSKSSRLSTRAEWVIITGGEQPQERFPWDEPGKAETTKEDDDAATIAEVVRRANVYQSEIGHTTPVWMFPKGPSNDGSGRKYIGVAGELFRQSPVWGGNLFRQ